MSSPHNDQNEEAAPFVQARQTDVAESVREQTPSTGAIRESVEQLRQQVPSTESVTQQLPSAQDAADTVRQGVSSIANGLGNLVNMATSTTAPQLSTDDKPKDDDAQNPHVPGGFGNEDEISKTVLVASQQDSERKQDNNLTDTQATRPGVEDSNLATTSNLPGSTQQARGSESTEDRQEKKYNLDDGTRQSSGVDATELDSSRVPVAELQSLPISEQDKNLTETAAARPGATSAVSHDAPVGVSSSASGDSPVSSTNDAPGDSNQTTGEQLASGAEYVKQSVGSGAQYVSEQLPSQTKVQETVQDAAQAAYSQIPSAQSVKETAQNSAQYVSDQLPSQDKVQGTAQNVGQAAYNQLPSSQAIHETAQSGAKQVSDQLPSQQQVQEAVQNATETAYNQLPSSQAVHETAQSGAKQVSDQLPSQQQVQEAVQNATETAYNQLPSSQAVHETAQSGAKQVSDQLPSQQQVQESVQNATETAYNQLPSTQNAQEPMQTGTRQVSDQFPSQETTQRSAQDMGQSAYEQIPSIQVAKETAQAGAQSAVDLAQAGAHYTKDAVQNTAQTVPEAAATGSQASADQQQAVPSPPQDTPTKTMQSTADEVMTGESRRPAHAGAAAGIPRDTVESTAEPDVSYEHRPKTLPQTEIAEREKERGALGIEAAPERVLASHRAADSGLEAAGSAEAVHEKSEVEKELLQKVAPAPADAEAVAPADSGSSSTVPASGAGPTEVGNSAIEGVGIPGASATTTAGVPAQTEYPGVGSLQSGGVHNGVIGAGSDELKPLFAPSAGEKTLGGATASAENGQAERIIIAEPDLTAGVHNGVVGAGSQTQ